MNTSILNFGKKFLSMMIIFSFLCSPSAISQEEDGNLEDDLEIGQDIFSDFSEDIIGAEMAEDERYYRYGRFFSFALGLGLTSFDGNRGSAYINQPPSFALQLNYFMNFQTSFGLGFEFSKHHFFIDEPVNGYAINAPGLISVNALRVFFGYRYYMDTSDLGTAVTYANPYFTGRMEYWYLSNKFEDQSQADDSTGGGLGFAAGLGFEFPIEIRKSYLGVEFLFHGVNFHDKYTQDYRPLTAGAFGYDDLTGNTYSTIVYYVMSW